MATGTIKKEFVTDKVIFNMSQFGTATNGYFTAEMANNHTGHTLIGFAVVTGGVGDIQDTQIQPVLHSGTTLYIAYLRQYATAKNREVTMNLLFNT